MALSWLVPPVLRPHLRHGSGKSVDLAFEFLLDGSDGNAEDALATPEDVDDLVGTVGGIDRGAIGQQGHVGEGRFALQLLAEDVHGAADLLEAHPGVEQTLDDLELHDVGEGVEALRTGAVGCLNRTGRMRPVRAQ